MSSPTFILAYSFNKALFLPLKDIVTGAVILPIITFLANEYATNCWNKFPAAAFLAWLAFLIFPDCILLVITFSTWSLAVVNIDSNSDRINKVASFLDLALSVNDSSFEENIFATTENYAFFSK